MISAEAPIIFAKACEIFILELTLRAWIQTEENKRRTLQRSDVGAAISKNDTFDFLIDIVPRDELRSGGGGGKKDDFSRFGSSLLQQQQMPSNVMLNETMAAMNYYNPFSASNGTVNSMSSQAPQPTAMTGTAMDQQQLMILQAQYQQQLQQQQQFQQYLLQQQQQSSLDGHGMQMHNLQGSTAAFNESDLQQQQEDAQDSQ